MQNQKQTKENNNERAGTPFLISRDYTIYCLRSSDFIVGYNIMANLEKIFAIERKKIASREFWIVANFEFL